MPTLFRSKFEKKLSELRKRGSWFVLKKFFRDHIYGYSVHVILERDFSKDWPKLKRKKTFDSVWIDSREDLEKFRENFSHDMRGIIGMYEKGRFCAAALDEGAVVGHIWYGLNEVYEAQYNYTFRLKKDEVYQTAGYLLPKYRRGTMAMDGMKRGHDYFTSRGIRKAICAVDTALRPIVKFHLKIGFEERGTVLHTRKLFFYRWSQVEHYEGTRYDALKKRIKETALEGIDGKTE